MSYLTKAHSMFAWTGFFCLVAFVVCFVTGPNWFFKIAGATGLTGVFLGLILAGVAASLSTGLVASVYDKQKGGEDIGEKQGHVEAAETKVA